ncbi:hypothetical protein BDV93DRAFT_514741 [Ceratobasidium sp. AG-I]|nr:hypothetical protein BDV93DRAFT_514741 [Ceratobasidium sp. AG-I]
MASTSSASSGNVCATTGIPNTKKSLRTEHIAKRVGKYSEDRLRVTYCVTLLSFYFFRVLSKRLSQTFGPSTNPDWPDLDLRKDEEGDQSTTSWKAWLNLRTSLDEPSPKESMGRRIHLAQAAPMEDASVPPPQTAPRASSFIPYRVSKLSAVLRTSRFVVQNRRERGSLGTFLSSLVGDAGLRKRCPRTVA